jgi:hypothetical protein
MVAQGLFPLEEKHMFLLEVPTGEMVAVVEI